jgi:hypothetical protein
MPLNTAKGEPKECLSDFIFVVSGMLHAIKSIIFHALKPFNSNGSLFASR